MRAAALYGQGSPMRIIEAEIPQNAEDEVLIKVAACGVCHTDLKLIEGRIPYKPPSVPGHEVSGVIEKVGSRCKMGLREGEKVIVGLRYKCGVCAYCLSGRENLCLAPPKPSPLKGKDGSIVNRWNVGGFSEYLAVPEYMVSKLPVNLPLQESSILGCRVTTAYNAAVNGAELRPGDSALVIGCGGVGLNLVQFLSLFGAYPIIAVDLIPAKLEAARKMGATHTVDASKEDPVKYVKEVTGLGVDKGFEAIGLPKTCNQVMESTKPGGTAILVGGMRGPMMVNDSSFAFREIKVTGVALRRPKDVQQVLELASRGKVRAEQFITNRYTLDQINDAYHDLEQGRILMMGIVTM